MSWRSSTRARPARPIVSHVSGASTSSSMAAAERRDVPLGNQPSRDAILDELRDAAMPGADDGQAARQCLEDRHRRPLLIAIRRGDARRDRAGARRRSVSATSSCCSQPANRTLTLALTPRARLSRWARRGPSPMMVYSIGTQAANPRQRAQGVLDAFFLDESRDGHDPDRLVRRPVVCAMNGKRLGSIPSRCCPIRSGGQPIWTRRSRK